MRYFLVSMFAVFLFGCNRTETAYLDDSIATEHEILDQSFVRNVIIHKYFTGRRCPNTDLYTLQFNQNNVHPLPKDALSLLKRNGWRVNPEPVAPETGRYPFIQAFVTPIDNTSVEVHVGVLKGALSGKGDVYKVVFRNGVYHFSKSALFWQS